MKKIIERKRKMRPTKAQEEELWKGCRLTLLYEIKGGYLVKDSEGITFALTEATMMYALLKHAVSKVLEKYDLKMFSFYDDLNNKVFWFVHAIDRTTNEVEFANIEGCEELKDALFWTLYPILVKEKDNGRK